MKLFLGVVFVFITLMASAQSVSLKKKYLKSYFGQIPAYEVNLNNQLIPVNTSSIEVPEIIFLNAKEKKITRRGLFPQPDAFLERRK